MRLSFSEVKILQRNDVSVKVSFVNNASEVCGTLDCNYYNILTNEVMVVACAIDWDTDDNSVVRDCIICKILPVADVTIVGVTVDNRENVTEAMNRLIERYGDKVIQSEPARKSTGRGLEPGVDGDDF